MGYRVAQLAHGFAVKNAEAERVSPVFPDKEGALDWLLTAAERRAPRERPCLSCQKPFESKGIHDRLCPACGHRPDDGLGDAQRPVIKSRGN
ncbi:hypothetical protein SAMN05421763_103308 [[Luteovulum] sphaeroides subsp. megalophilum]|uniref:hypothetical protein n=1 Tax=Cereibacter sphaeroides TaxID=1063 RepID=UPI000B69963A|nr:hypothetical protein [Cereibacter sphaeroides]SNS87395.1 hypothetical protein SAMN05421763_103308 [[Luteovulum] sphaeroides subsp. megalophilum]